MTEQTRNNWLPIAAYAAETNSHATQRFVSSRHFMDFEERFDLDAYQAKLDGLGIRWVDRGDIENYPAKLRFTTDPPAGLFVRGDGPLSLLNDSMSIAVVGARACSEYGASFARRLSCDLADAGITVVSGMARGIDGWAHRGALDAEGPTVAVLGCGIDIDYPRAHTELAKAIVAGGGLIVSEYAPGVAPAPWRFPARNRIQAGMTSGTVVVEARERSGSMITADLAREDRRFVFAVPGPVGVSTSEGTNLLLKQGAILTRSARDVLDALLGKEARKP